MAVIFKTYLLDTNNKNSKMKKAILLVFCVLTLVKTQAQYSLCKSEDFQKFLTSTCYFVLDDDKNSEYNTVLKETVERIWTVTPYKFITHAQAKSHTNPNYSLVYRYSDRCLNKSTDYCIGIVRASKSLEGNNPYSFYAFVKTYCRKEKEYVGMVPNLIQMLQEVIEQRKEKQLYSQKTDYTEIKSKKLLIPKDILKDSLESDMREVYPYSFEIVDRSVIEEAIKNGDESVLYIDGGFDYDFTNQEPTQTLVIINPGTGKVICKRTTSSTSFKEKFNHRDFKALAKAIAKAEE
jgi:hypothetical protein